MNAQLLIQERLRQRLLEAKLKNSRVSVRSFAKQMKLPAGTVSLVLLGKRKISYKLAQKFADALYFDPIELARLDSEFKAEPVLKKSKQTSSLTTEEKFKPENLRLSADQFHVMKDWYYFGILNLISTQGYEHDANWISSRLGISAQTAADAIERLERLKLISKTKSGKVVRNHKKLSTTDEIQNLSVRYSHYQNLELAKTALDECALNTRDFTWLTLPISDHRMPEMKLMIRKFQDEFIENFGQEHGANEVARLSVQLFPISKNKKTKKEVVV